MDMPSRILWMQNQLINFRSTKMEHAGFKVINPHDGVAMTSHVSLPCILQIRRINSKYSLTYQKPASQSASAARLPI
jgi:hypothetical protein